MMDHSKGCWHSVSFILLIVGGLNWLLLGIFNWEIGSLLGGMSSLLSRIVYILVGLAAVYELMMHRNHCEHCQAKGGTGGGSQPMRPGM